jgi:hypothetical protein
LRYISAPGHHKYNEAAILHFPACTLMVTMMLLPSGDVLQTNSHRQADGVARLRHHDSHSFAYAYGFRIVASASEAPSSIPNPKTASKQIQLASAKQSDPQPSFEVEDYTLDATGCPILTKTHSYCMICGGSDGNDKCKSTRADRFRSHEFLLTNSQHDPDASNE